MIASVLESYRAEISALPFVERYGGLVRKMPYFPGNDQPPSFYPVSCSVSAQDCYEQGKYKQLVPDTAFTSIFYFEQLTSVSITPGPRRDFSIASASVRLVGWLNLAKLGITSCDGIDGIIINLLTHAKRSIDTPINAGQIRLQAAEVEPRSLDVFRDYSYDNLTDVFFYPYDFFAIRFKLSWTFGKDCLPEIEITPVECLEL